MNDIAIIRLRELAQLDQLEAHLLELLAHVQLATERRAINKRLHRLNRLRALWRQPIQPNTVNRDQKGNG